MIIGSSDLHHPVRDQVDGGGRASPGGLDQLFLEALARHEV
jgi:hypothetical protein